MTYAHIHGHEAPIAFLKEVVSSQRTAHAYLFFGPEGIGKKKVALSFAASLLCPTPARAGEGCGACSSCKRVLKGTHPDIITISAIGTSIRIQEIRDAITAIKVRPLEGSNRVVIIDEAERMSEPAANAVLKTLEEPPRGNFFLLITARPYKLPTTIVSRCQPLMFSPLSKAQIMGFLKESLKLPEEKAEIIAACAGGSVSEALKLSHPDYLSFREKMQSIWKTVLAAGPMAPVVLSRALGQDKIELEEKLHFLATLFRDALWFQETRAKEGIVNLDFFETVKTIGERLAPGQIIKNIQALTQARLNLEQNVNKSLTLEASLVSLTFP